MRKNILNPKNLLIALGFTVFIIISYLLALSFPQLFFTYKYSFANLNIYTTKKYSVQSIENIQSKVIAKLKKSEIYNDKEINVFIADNQAVFGFFVLINPNAGGMYYPYFNQNIFIRPSNIENNTLISPSGVELPEFRSLDYFISHEATHKLTHDYLGVSYPVNTTWVLEGYAEYIAHGSMNFKESLDSYLNLPENQTSKKYAKWRTIIAYLIDVEKLNTSNIWNMLQRENELERLINPSKIIPNIQETYIW